MRTGALFALVITITASPVLAQDHGDAQSLFDDGKRLMNERRYAEACPKFAESNRMDPSLGTLLWLGGCYEKTGQNASALATFRSAAQIASQTKDEREGVAREHVDRLDAVVFKLTVVVPSEVASTPNIEIRRDGVVMPPDAWAAAIPLDPGTHVVTASAPNRRTFEEHVEAGPTGGKATVTIAPLAIVEERHDILVTPRPVLVARGGTQRVIGWTFFGAGLASGLIGAAFGFDAKSKLDASAAAPHNCVATLCDDQGGVDLRHAALGSALASTVAFIAGGVLVATGIVVVVTAPGLAVRGTF